MRVALPGGRLWPQSQALMTKLGIRDHMSSRRYVFGRGGDLEILALKIPDIPAVLHDGRVDLAVASDEWLAEFHGAYVDLGALCWYHVTICLLAPADHDRSLTETIARTVATPYPRLAARLLAARLLPAQSIIEPVRGAVEAYPGRLTDLALDCVETGTTASANGLVVVREVMRCDVRLAASPTADLTTPLAQEMISMLQNDDLDSCHFTADLTASSR